MKQKKITIAKGLNKMVYNRNEIPVDGVKLPFEQLKVLCEEGDKLGVELARQMMDYGFDFYGIFVKTYALTQMVAYLKVFAAAKGFDAMAMFEAMTPKFTKEGELMLEVIESEKRQQQRSGFKFLDLSCPADVKEFKKVMKNLKDVTE